MTDRRGRWIGSRIPSRIPWLDLKLGVRMLLRYPGLTLVGTAAIAVAIALGTLYFEAINKWRNPRLPTREPERVVSIRNWDAERGRTEERSLHDFVTWREQASTVQPLGAAVAFVRNLATDDGEVEPVPGAEITANTFQMLEATPLLGRTLSERDEHPGEPLVVVIGYGLWQGRFQGDPAVLGRTVRVGTATASIIGVMPEGFGFPMSERLWLPLRVDGSQLPPRTGPAVSVYGRLAPGASMEDAEAEFRLFAERMAASDPDAYQHLIPRVTVYAQPLTGSGEMMVIRNILYAANGIFLMLLAIVCVNVATLVFARAATRGWEISVRTALGASRGRIISQLFIEALALTSLATLVGLVIARLAMWWGLGGLRETASVRYWINDSLSWSTVAYAFLLALIGAAIVGILPALRVTKRDVQDSLRGHGEAGSSLRFGGLWTTVIVVQVALTVALLPLAAGGLFESNRFAQRAEGIGADQYLIASVSFDHEDYGADSTTFALRGRMSLDELERRLRAEPEVSELTFADRLPVEDQFKYRIEVDTAGGAPETGLRRSTLVQTSRGFFDAFGTSVVAGRDFQPLDFDTGRTMIVNQSFVREVLGGRNPIGQRIRIVSGEVDRFTGDEWYEIVGVVRDFGWQLPRPEEQSAMYQPRLPTAEAGMKLSVKVPDPELFAARLRAVAAEVDPSMRLTDVRPLAGAGGGEATINWAITWIAWLVAFMVLMLSASGIHALMSFTVARRTREIGIRVALGADSRRIVSGIFSRAILQVGAGVLAGGGLYALLGRGSQHYVLLLVAACGTMLLVGLGACLVPLRRALRVDPMEALRVEG